MHRAAPLVLILLAACESTATYPEGEDACRRQTQVQVLEFLDGDTAEVQYMAGDLEGTTDRIRLNAVDSAEVDHDDEAASDCWALEAWEASVAEFEGKLAWLTFDTECSGEFDRTLAYMFRDEDGLFLNQHLILEGHSPAFYPDYSLNRAFEAEFLEAEERAASQLKGGWAECGWQLGGMGT